MKKITLILAFVLLYNYQLPTEARCNHSYHSHHSTCHSSSGRSHVYLVKKDQTQETAKFPNCDKHLLQTNTTINYYSDGTRRVYRVYSVLNTDGSVLESGLSDAKHTIYNDKHYLFLRKNKKYKIYDDNGKVLSIRDYTFMEEIAPNRLLITCNKKQGIINLEEKIIVPIKYKSIKKVGKDLFITKLNGYWGMLNSNNNILIKNEYDKIKQVNEAFLLKKHGKYGLADFNGKILYEAKYDKIKPLGEHFLIKQDKKYGVLDSYGKEISKITHKKIRLKRNVLEFRQNNKWYPIGLSFKNI